MSYTEFANNFCLYRPCEHFWFALLPAIVIFFILAIIVVIKNSPQTKPDSPYPAGDGGKTSLRNKEDFYEDLSRKDRSCFHSTIRTR